MSLLLAIHSYPGANAAVARHFPYYEKSGADKIIGIGTTDNRCGWPQGVESENIGSNSYIDGDVLPRRLVNTMRFMLKHDFDRFCLIEYDCIFFKPLPEFAGLAAFKAGHKHGPMKAEAFYHCPWCFDRTAGEAFVAESQAMLGARMVRQDSIEASPDLFFGWVAERAGLPVGQPWFQYSQNSLDCHGALEDARDHYRRGAVAIHGIKHASELEFILA